MTTTANRGAADPRQTIDRTIEELRAALEKAEAAKAALTAAERVVQELTAGDPDLTVHDAGEAVAEFRTAAGTNAPSVRLPPPELVAEIERLTRRRPTTVREIAEEVRLSPARVSAACRALARAGRLVWVEGFAEIESGWYWKVGDNAPTTPDLRTAVENLLKWGPMTHKDLVDATGARPGRVQGLLVEWLSKGRLLRHGEARRQVYLLAPEGMTE